MTAVTGPQSLRSAADGVIRLRTRLTAVIAKASQLAQRGQFGQSPAPDRMPPAIKTSTTIDRTAATLARDAKLVQHGVEGARDVACCIAGTCGVQARVYAFEHGFFRIQQRLWWRA